MTESWLLTEGYRDKDHPGSAHAVGAEFLLSGHNVFGEAWYAGELDGVIGPKAVTAFKQAKFDIGYDEADIEPTFGPTRAGDVKYSRADISRTKADLGYSPEVTFAEGLRRTVTG